MSQGGDCQRLRLGVLATPRLAIANSSPLLTPPGLMYRSAFSVMHQNRGAPHHRATGGRSASLMPPITSPSPGLENP
jgi:hypothetical protein